MLHIDQYPEPSDDVLGYIDAHQKIQAIKAYRAQTDCGLKEAKCIVDRVASQRESVRRIAAMESHPEPSLHVLSCIDAGDRIQAIKAYRAQTDCTLKEAMDVIDYVYARRGIQAGDPTWTALNPSSSSSALLFRGRSNANIVAVAVNILVVSEAIILLAHLPPWLFLVAAIGALAIAVQLSEHRLRLPRRWRPDDRRPR